MSSFLQAILYLAVSWCAAMFLIAVVKMHAGEGAAVLQKNNPSYPGMKCAVSADPEQELPGSNTAPRLLFP